MQVNICTFTHHQPLNVEKRLLFLKVDMWRIKLMGKGVKQDSNEMLDLMFTSDLDKKVRH